jgi:hypothetical protein
LRLIRRLGRNLVDFPTDNHLNSPQQQKRNGAAPDHFRGFLQTVSQRCVFGHLAVALLPELVMAGKTCAVVR